jgi:hypothetical protein
MMKTKYIKPMTDIHAVITEKFICNSKTTDSASIGGTGSANEKNQEDIDTGGPGVAGSKKNLFEEQYSNSLWED